MTMKLPDTPVELLPKRPWLEMFDELLAPQAQSEYGFLPTHWLDARGMLEDVDAGRAYVVLHGGEAFLMRGASLEQASLLTLLLARFLESGGGIRFKKSGGAA